ncbi:PhzF family phenazine biosynthesis protein [Phenylobacterium sp. VNQ135]|uniref:PhzF family phenazine biosynthesis protein n=1 Tax=Phenylobacterium sp. VNQ135 TaxID=3400922 RepID=UPI003C08CC9A
MRQWTVDAFAAQPFRGNPACVVEPFEGWPDDAWMQALAAENNQAETAFLRRMDDPARFDLRWFTPAVEVPLCGHATLAAAHVLYSELGLAAASVAFDTRSGRLVVARRGDGYEMDFPSQPPTRIEPPAGLAEALGVRPREVWVSTYLVAVLDDEATVRALRPDIPALASVGAEASGGPGNIGVAAMAGPAKPYQVVSRFFGPGCGIPEDPATGSLYCILAPLFSDKLERASLAYHQAFPGRGGDLQCEVRGDRVLIRGRAVTVLTSQLHA